MTPEEIKKLQNQVEAILDQKTYPTIGTHQTNSKRLAYVSGKREAAREIVKLLIGQMVSMGMKFPE